MDVYGYLPDVFSYSSMRHPYGSPQNNAWAPEATREKRPNKVTNQRPPGKSSSASSCQDCPICQERKRRPLASYIRSKSRQDRCASSSISEDSEDVIEEEEEEEEKQMPAQQQAPKIPVKK